MIIADSQGRTVPKEHVVKEGDTLWGICGDYYANPWVWPQVWANNRSITNPHWIYPGDRIHLVHGKSVGRELKSATGAIITFAGGRRYDNRPILLRQDAFADAKELKKSGRIVGSRQERLLLSAMDEVYVRGGGDFKPEVGKVYSVYRIKNSLKSAKGSTLGNKVQILGSLRIKRINESKVATAEIIDSYYPIHRNDKVGLLRRQYKRLPVKPAKKDLVGHLIDTMRPGRYVAAGELVFVDKGTRDGVENGNRFLVMRRGDGYRQLAQLRQTDNKNYPRETIAEISILDARENASVGMITRSTKELQDGDYLRMRRGY